MPAESARAPGPREWVGQGSYPWPALQEMAAGTPVVACYCVVAAQKDVTKQGKPYYKLQLTDRHGAAEGRVWDPVAEVMAGVRPGGFVGVRGTVELFNGARQVKISEIVPIQVGPEDLELFLPRSPREPAAMETELNSLIDSVQDAGLRALLLRLLGPASETGRRFRSAPAAKLNHHASIGGLLQHTLSVAHACSFMAQHYAPHLDRDLLIAGALLHDLGKTREIAARAGFPYTDEGKLLGHILLGLQMVADAAREVPELDEQRLLLLQHLIASHQGRYEWQSPREPRTLEALILHYCDDIDAKMNQAMTLLDSLPQDSVGWTAHDRSFGREFLLHLQRPSTSPGPSPSSEAEHDQEQEHEQENEPDNENENGRRRRVRFAGGVGHPGEGKGKAKGENEVGAEGVVEALPPRPVAPAEDVLPPDPQSLDLFG